MSVAFRAARTALAAGTRATSLSRRRLLSVCLVTVAILASPIRADDTYPVSVVPSDDPTLPLPVPRDAVLETDHVTAMVRRAVDLVGGMQSVVPDTARLVVLKPNIGTYGASYPGTVTDPRVVRAVALLVHEVAPEARILVGEAAGGWADPAFQDCTDVEIRPWYFRDGFERAGYRQMVAQLRDRGLDIECLDLNFDQAYSLRLPEGGLAADEYSIAASIIDADVWINIPVAKTHGAKITCCMKNHFGIVPGTIYGWEKSRGTSRHAAIPHRPRILDEAFIDLWRLSRMDLNVVDMIRGSEAGAFEPSGRRQNIILAGRNPVATDLTVARLMGYNPDDMEFGDLARQLELGPRWLEDVDLRGADPAPLAQRFIKAGSWYGDASDWSTQANYGKGPRRWTLLGPLPRDHAFTATEVAELRPTPEENGWSEIVWFGHDIIDLDRYYNDPVRSSAYAYTRFFMPQADSVRYWMGADEGLQVWIDGQPLFDMAQHPGMGGRREHKLGMVRLPGYLEAGEHRLLVRADQNRGAFDFSFNICEPIDDDRFAGNTYPGLRYLPVGDDVGARVEYRQTGRIRKWRGKITAQRGDLLLAPHPTRTVRNVEGEVTVANARVSDSDQLVAVLLAATDSPVDPADVAWLHDHPYGMTPVGPQAFLDLSVSAVRVPFPSVETLMRLFGLRYRLSVGHGRHESLTAIHEWLTMGHLPMTGIGHSWAVLSGFRTDDKGVAQVRVGARWYPMGQSWSGKVPGYGGVSCPVVAAQPDPDAVPPTDPVLLKAHVILQLALTPSTTGAALWGGPLATPTGLAAWDWSIAAWEDVPLTVEWARQGLNWSLLARMRAQHLDPLITDRRRAASDLLLAGRGVQDGAYRGQLEAAARAYEQAAGHLEKLHDALPTDPRRPFAEEDITTLEGIRQVRGALRNARSAERRALAILADWLGADPLPPTWDRPSSRPDGARRVATCRTEKAEGIYTLTLQGKNMTVDSLDGTDDENVDCGMTSSVPDAPGWRLAVETAKGMGVGWVLQQARADNDWRAVIQLDNQAAFWGDPDPVIEVWAVPVEAVED